LHMPLSSSIIRIFGISTLISILFTYLQYQ
jgi:hypothetical protein